MIEVKNLEKSFGTTKILKNVSLCIPSGQIVGLVGSSGGGKTTLLRCMQSLEIPDLGEVTSSGRVGFVFQHFNLYPHMTVWENILYSPVKVLKQDVKIVEERALDLLSRMAILDKKDSYPVSLSGGQKQRVSIVRTLMMDPDVLLLDEPVSALDPKRVQIVVELLKELASVGKTFVIVSHQIDFLEHVVDRVVVLDRGEIIEDCSSGKFFEQPKDVLARKYFDFNF